MLHDLVLYIHIQFLGTDRTSFAYGWVWNEYLSGHNAVIFLRVFTYVAVIISECTKIVIGLGTSNVPVPLVHFVHQNLWRSTIVKVNHSMWPTI